MVTIPNNVTTIGHHAFLGCSGMSSITIGKGVTTIGNEAFWGCNGLSSITIPNSVSRIGEAALSGCSALKEIKVNSKNLNYCDIDGVLFDKNKQLLVQYPGGLVGGYIIPNGVTTIGYSAFRGCSGLSLITIPNSVAIIGESVFSGCSGLTSVTIGSSVATIGDGAFVGCRNLVEINSLNSVPPTIGYGSFDDTQYKKANLNVVKGSLNAYKEAPYWKRFLNIQEKDFGGVEAVDRDEVKVFANGTRISVAGADENAKVEVYNFNGQLVCRGCGNDFEVGKSGIYIVRIAGKAFKVVVK